MAIHALLATAQEVAPPGVTCAHLDSTQWHAWPELPHQHGAPDITHTVVLSAQRHICGRHQRSFSFVHLALTVAVTRSFRVTRERRPARGARAVISVDTQFGVPQWLATQLTQCCAGIRGSFPGEQQRSSAGARKGGLTSAGDQIPSRRRLANELRLSQRETALVGRFRPLPGLGAYAPTAICMGSSPSRVSTVHAACALQFKRAALC